MVTKHCCYGTCNSDTRYNHKPHMQGVTFLPFPQPSGDLEKCKRWIAACQRVGFTVENVKKHTYICTKHFVGGKGPTDQYPDPIPAGLEPMVLQSAITQKLTYPVAKRQRAAYVRKQKKQVEVSAQWTSQKSVNASLSFTNSKECNPVVSVLSCPIPRLQDKSCMPITSVGKNLDSLKKKPTITRKRRASAPSVLTTPPYLKQMRLDGSVISSRLASSHISKRRPSGPCSNLSQSTVSLMPCLSEDGELVLMLVNSSGDAEGVQLPSSAVVDRTDFPREIPLQGPTSGSPNADFSEITNVPDSTNSNFVERDLHADEPSSSVTNYTMNFVETCSTETPFTTSDVDLSMATETTNTVDYINSNQTFVNNAQVTVLPNVTVKIEPSSELVSSVACDSITLNKNKSEHPCVSVGLDVMGQEVNFIETEGTICKVENDSCISSPSHQVLFSVIFNDDNTTSNNTKNVTNRIQQLSSTPVDLNLQLGTFGETADANLSVNKVGSLSEQPILINCLDSTLLLGNHVSKSTAANCEKIDVRSVESLEPTEGTVRELLSLSSMPDDNAATNEYESCTSVDISNVLIATDRQLLSEHECLIVDDNKQKDTDTVDSSKVVCSEPSKTLQASTAEISNNTVELGNQTTLESNRSLPVTVDTAVSKSKTTVTKFLKTSTKCRRKPAPTLKKMNSGAATRPRGRRKKLCQAPVAVAYVADNRMEASVPQNTVLNNLTVVQNPNPLPSVQVSTVQLPPQFLSTPQFVVKNSTLPSQNRSNHQAGGRRQPRPIAPNTSRILTNKSPGGASAVLLNNTPFVFQNSTALQPVGQQTLSSWPFYYEIMRDGWTVRIDDKRYFHLINNFGVSKSVVIDKDSYNVSIFDSLLPTDHSVLTSFPPKIITDNDLRDLLKRVKALKVCIGNPEEKFIRMVLETGLPKVKFCRVANSVYSSFCSTALVDGLRCDQCLRVRTILQHMVRRKESKYLRVLSDDNVTKEGDTNLPKMIKTNKIPDEPKVYLSVAELRSKIYSLKRKLKAERQKNLRLRIKLKNSASTEKEIQEHELNMPVDLDTFDKDSFCYVFIQEQIRASKCKQKGMRWHPSILKWCTNLRNTSPAGYTLLRQEFRLPSERTLCNYADARHATPEKAKVAKTLERNGTAEVQECVITIIRRPEGEDCVLLNADGTVANAETSDVAPSNILKLTQFDPDGVPINEDLPITQGKTLGQCDSTEHSISNADDEAATFFEKTDSITVCDMTAACATENTVSGMNTSVHNMEETAVSGAENGVITRINTDVLAAAINSNTITDSLDNAVTNTESGSFAAAELCLTNSATVSADIELQPSNSDENYTVTIVGDSAGSEVVQYIIQDLTQTVVTIDGTDYVIEEMAPLTALLDEP